MVMRQAVLKYTVPVDGRWHEIPMQDVLHVECQHDSDNVQVWVLDYGHPQPPQMRVRLFGTGEPLPDRVAHLGSTVTSEGRLVWHLFRAVER